MKARAAVVVAAMLLLGGSLPAVGSSGGGVFSPVATPPLATADPPDRLSPAEFVDPPMWARPQAYWLPSRNTTLAGSIEQLRTFKQAGLGGVTFEPGGPLDGTDIAGPHLPGPGWPFPYLSDAWFAFFDSLLAEAERLGMTAYLLDVPFTMSGSAQGQVAEPVRGGDPALGWTSLVEVVPGVQYESVTRPYWLDPLNPDAVQRSIDLNYGLHHERLGHHFGGALQVMWSDEVGFQPTASPGTFRGGIRQKEIPWSPTFPDYFRDLKGYDLTPEHLAAVFSPDPRDPGTRRVSYDYWDAVSRRFAEVYYGGLARWTAARGLGFIGQLLAEEETNSHFATEGSYFRAAAQATVVSTDLLGEASPDHTGLPFCGDGGCYGTTQKLASSTAHLFGRKRVHLEAYDLANDELKHRPQMLKALIDNSISRGVNLIALHSYDWDGGGYNVDNVLFGRQRLWNDYTARLQYLFTPGRTLPDVAVGYPIEAFWIGDQLDKDAFALVSGTLRSAHYEHDFFPLELLEDPAVTVDDGVITAGTQSYRALVVPDWSTVSLGVMGRLRQFVDGGGTVASVGRLPGWETQGADAALQPLVADLFGLDPSQPPTAVTVHPFGAGTAIWMPGDFTADVQELTPERVRALDPLISAMTAASPPRVRVEGDPLLPSGLSAVAVLPYRRAGSDFYFVTNFPRWADKPPGHFGFSHDFPGQRAAITLEVPAHGVPERWDPQTGAVERIWHYEVVGDRLRIPLRLPSFGSAVIRLAPGKPAAEPHVAATNLIDVTIAKGRVRGYVPANLDTEPFAVLARGHTSTRLEGDAVGRAEPLDVTYDVTFSDGMAQRRRAGPWTAPRADTGATARPWFVGSGTYAAVVELPAAPPNGRVVLDLGGVGDVAAVAINGIDVGVRAWPGHVFDVTRAVRDGTDELAVTVTTSQAAAFPNDPRYPAGLLGPVMVRVEPLLVLGP